MTSRASFDSIVAEHEDELLRICRAVLHDEHLGRDAMQEAFVKLWRAGPRASEPAGRGAWLRRVALTSAIDLARRTARQGRIQARAEEASSDPAEASTTRPAARDAASGTPAEHVLAAELRRELDAAVESLPDRQREVFRLRHHAGLPLAEVAARLGVEVTTVKTQFARACWKLQARLAPFLDEDHEDRM